jgi:uncharacterized protein (TIGR00288 family)
MAVKQSQRVGVLVDVQNMYWSARTMYKARVNFNAVLKAAAENRTLVRALAYVVSSGTKEEKQFFEALTKAGFEVKEKELQVFYGGAKKADWDVGLAMDAIRLGEKMDVIVLVSGDGDFAPLVTYLRERGTIVRVISFGRSSSAKLIEAADEFVDMDKEQKRFLLKGK